MEVELLEGKEAEIEICTLPSKDKGICTQIFKC